MSIEKSILQLLYYKDCVIIPGFGGFICSDVPAIIKADSQSFSPPSREVGFNPVLTRDDGLLKSYLSKIENVGEEKSSEMIEEFVDNIHKVLLEKGRFSITSIGEFSYSRTGQLIFRASREINFLPSSYGLASFHFALLERENERSPLRSAAFRYNGKSRTVVLPGLEASPERKQSLRRIALALPLLLVVSLLPLNQRSNKSKNTAGIMPLPSLSFVEMSAKNEASSNSSEGLESSENQAIGAEEIQAFDRSSYAIVAGSFSSEKNAGLLKKEFENKGHYTEIWEASNGFYRVVIQAHDQLSTAEEALDSLQKDFRDIQFWILK